MSDTSGQAADSENNIPLLDLDPSSAGVAELDLYQKREKIYTRKIEGFYQRIRVYTGWPLLLGYFILPWVNWGGRQMVLFDLPARKFHILGLTFWPQDFPLLAGLLIIAAYALFTVTAWVGRVWCGYTCPQTVWTAIFMWAEQLCEGSRNQRIKRDQAPWSRDKLLRKTGKHVMWFGFAFLTGLTFVGYFTPIRELTADFFSLQITPWSDGYWQFAWIMFFTLATYINAGWMREQVCMYMCPYARFQSVMFDSNTLIVTYDNARGEPRGARKKNVNPDALQLGDCVDCKVCVQVCPTGIDIRDGLQYQCINCALCIDGCNSIMEQMGYAKGLIRYSTENELLGQPAKFISKRVIAYATVLLVMISLFVATLVNRVPLRIDVIRDRDKLYAQLDEHLIENSYMVKVLNMDQAQHSYRLSVSGVQGLNIVGDTALSLASGEIAELPVRLRIDPRELQSQHNSIQFEVQAAGEPSLRALAESRFIGPSLSDRE
ncbi:MAG: cytochrome c oxidase accessory protein CcoG [Pseudomonadales bacterium]